VFPTLVEALNVENGAVLLLLLEELVMIVSESSGMLSFFVRRMDADVAWKADLRARRRGLRGTSRFITLEAADCIT
jgi:hypothetical protein